MAKYSNPMKSAQKTLKYAEQSIAQMDESIKQAEALKEGYIYRANKMELALNNKPDSPFYGLKHMTKFQTLKYIADKFDICDDMVDLIYKKLKQSELWGQIGRAKNNPEWCKIPRRVENIMTIKTPHELQWIRRHSYDNKSAVLLSEEREDFIKWGGGDRRIKIDSQICMLVSYPFDGNRKSKTKLKYIKTNGSWYNHIPELLKVELQELCNDREIPFKKSWKKSKLVEELVK
tara:strand:+ start:330 stop:1028 length:699 start_codon:yes stop_codon:yes gene_type:complete